MWETYVCFWMTEGGADMQELGCRNGEYIMETLAWRCILQAEMCSGQLSMELWRSGWRYEFRSPLQIDGMWLWLLYLFSIIR